MQLLSVTTTPSAWRGTSALSPGQALTALGLHPQIAHVRKVELGLFDDLVPLTRYVGEVGLDGGADFKPHREDQNAVFRHVLNACSRRGGRIMSIHSRRAAGAVLDQLEAHPRAGPAVLHWFSGTVDDLSRAVGLGCWFSVGPAMLNGKRGRMLAERMPRDRILTESDAPFAQIGRRPVLPWEVARAVETLACLWGSSAEETQSMLDDNLRRLTNS